MGMAPPPPHTDPAAKVAFVSGAAASAGMLAGLHARLLLIPPYKLLCDVLGRLGSTTNVDDLLPHKCQPRT